MPVLCTAREGLRALGPAVIRDVDGEGSLAGAQRAEVGNRPVKANQMQQALNEASHLPKGQAKQSFHPISGQCGAIYCRAMVRHVGMAASL